jgi:2-dehydropantoate 2-reductase
LYDLAKKMSLRITVIGVGGVGGYFGARLAQGGCEVGFVARGAQLAALREQGLRVESDHGNIHLPQVRVSEDPEALGLADVVLICVKLWDTESAARAVRPIIGSDTAVISLQNGVRKEELLSEIVGAQAVVGGLCYVAAKIGRPGVILQTGKMQRLVFGEPDGAASTRTQSFLEVCHRSGIEAEISADIRRAIWEKFVFVVGTSATTSTMRQTIGPIRANPRTRAFLLEVMREVVAVGRAHGVLLAEDFAETRLAFCDGLPPTMDSSMHTDLEQGKQLELEWLSGSVVELGEAVGVPTPLNRAVRDILELHAHGDR